MRKIQSKENLEKIKELAKEHGAFSGNVVSTLSEDLYFLRTKCEELFDRPNNMDAVLEEIKRSIGK